MLTYEKSLVEVQEILNYLPDEDYEKIPDEIINLINENKDPNYIWNYDESKNFEQQTISKEALAILTYINLNYLLNEKQKQYMEQILRLNDYNEESKKKELYDVEDIFKNKNNGTHKKIQPSVERNITVKQEKKWYQIVFNLIKGFFSRNKQD